MDVSIILVNYNTKGLTSNCIRSIQEHTTDILYEIILVDNNSSDGSVEFFRKMTDVLVIASDENLGFGRANNLGFKSAQGKFVFFLNSDTVLRENSVKLMRDFFVDNESALHLGSLGCVLVDENGVFNGDGAELPTCKSEVSKSWSNLPVLKSLIAKQKTRINGAEPCYPVGYVIGADLMMRSSVFRRLEGFDPQFFMYYEESDLQFRMKQLGLDSYIYKGTNIVHLEDGSGKAIKKYNNRKRIIVHTSRNLYLKKNDARNFTLFKFWDRIFLLITRFGKNYSPSEQREYENAIKKTYS